MEGDALAVERDALLLGLEAVRAGSAYGAFLRQRRGLAQHLRAARAEAAAWRFRVRSAFPEPERVRLETLPPP